MTKLRKQKKRKVYRYNVNRKRLRNRIFNVGKIECKEVKDAWDKNKSAKVNLNEMGLSYDSNQTLKIPKTKVKFSTSTASSTNDWIEEESKVNVRSVKGHIAEALEKNAKTPRVKLFRLPKGQVEWITYLMDKHGTNYEAMAGDKRNYWQETWKQLRAKIKRFMSIPEQYSKYLERKNGIQGSDLATEHNDNDDGDEVF